MGTELAGATKNAIAIAAGILDGLDPVDAIGLLMSRPPKEERLAE